MIVCLPVKNGWQLLHTSTRSSGRVHPTVHSVPHEPQWTLASKYLGWMSAYTGCSPPTPSVQGHRPAGGRRLRPVVGPPSGGRRGGLDRLDPDALLVLRRVLEVDLAGHGREHGVVPAEAGPRAGEEGHPALADDDRAGGDDLAVTDLHAQALADA